MSTPTRSHSHAKRLQIEEILFEISRSSYPVPPGLVARSGKTTGARGRQMEERNKAQAGSLRAVQPGPVVARPVYKEVQLPRCVPSPGLWARSRKDAHRHFPPSFEAAATILGPRSGPDWTRLVGATGGGGFVCVGEGLREEREVRGGGGRRGRRREVGDDEWREGGGRREGERGCGGAGAWVGGRMRGGGGGERWKEASG